MDDNVVDSLRIEIEGDSGKAIDSIGKLISTLEKIKNVTSGSNKGLNAIQKNLNKIAESVNKIDSGSASKLRDLAEGLKGLNEIKVSGKIADKLLDIGAAVELLKGVDFSVLEEMKSGLQGLGGVGNIGNVSMPQNVGTPSALTFDMSSLNEELSSMREITSSVQEATESIGEFEQTLSRIDAESVIKLTPEVEVLTMKLNAVKDKLQELLDDGSTDNSAIANLILQARDLEAKIKSIQREQARLAGKALIEPINADAFVQSKSDVDLLKMKLDEAKSKLQELLDSGNTNSSAVANLVSQINDLQDKIEEATHKTNVFKTVLSGLGTAVKKVGTFFGKTALSPIYKFRDAVKGVTGKVKELFTTFKKRAMYRAINAIISAITTGFKEGTANVYQYSKALGGTLASSLDNISTSFLYFKNSIGAAVAPLINMLAPAIDYIIDKCVDLLNALNQVFAKLSGASTWTKAVKYPTEYAEAAESATAANKELKKSILGIDEINPLTDNSSSGGGGAGSGMDYSQMFEEVELGEVNNPFKDFFKPFTDAWANEGQNTINAIKNAFNGVKEFISAVGESFRKVWTNGTGQQTVETILRIFQNILNCVGNLGSSLAKAWRANDNGTKILQNIWNIFNDLLGFVEGIYGATADWLASLDFTPLMTAFAGCTAALEPLVDLIGNTLLWLYQTVLLPIASWAIEEAAPASIDAITAALQMLQAFLQPFLAGFEQLWAALQPIVEWVEGVVIVVIDGVKSIFEKLAATFQEKGEKIQNIVSGIGDIISAVWVVVEPIFNLLKDLVGNVFGFIGDIISSVVGFAIDLFSGLIDFIAGVFTGDWERAWNGIKGIFVGIWDLIKGVALAVWDFLKGIWNSIKDNVESIWNGIKSFLSNIWNGIKSAASSIWEGLKNAVMTVVNGIKNGITTAFNAVKTFISTCFNTIKSIATSVWNAIWGAIKGVINGILGGIEGMVNGVIKGLNFMINALNKLSFDVPDWVPVIGGEKFGFNIKNISEVSLPRLADGGMVNAGTAFIAGEAGAEVVANIGKRTGVMNTDQMRESVEQGVMDANAEQNALLREEISILRKILDKDTPSSGYGGARSIISDIERKNRRDGKTVIPVGV